MSLHDDDAERIVLGSLLQTPELFGDLSQIVHPDDFFLESHRLIYSTISAEIDRHGHPDVMLVISLLNAANQLEKAGNRSYLLEIASQASPVSATVYARRVKELSLRRRLFSNIKDIEKNMLDPAVGLDELLSLTEKAVFQISDRFSQYNVQHVSENKNELLEYLKKVKASQGGVTGIATHFTEIDKMTTGLKGGQLLVLAARPGVGKTTFALNAAQNIALMGKLPILFFSLEMTRLELTLRMICSDAYLESKKINTGNIDDRDMKKIMTATTRLYGSDIYIDDSTDLSTWEFKQRSRRLAAQLAQQNKSLGLIVVDYLQLMTDKSKSSDASRQVEVANISRSLKLIAKDLNVPVLALSQMNRGIEQRGKDPRPQLSDLRESGAIEQDADIVMFIHREELYNRELPDSQKGQAEIIIAKHRGGPQGTVKLAFKSEINRFMNLDLHTEEPGH